MTSDPYVGAIFGRRRSGKTTRAKALTASDRRLVVFDPIGEWSSFGLIRVDSLDQLRDHLARTWRTGFRVAYVCHGDWPRQLDHVARWLMSAQRSGRGRAAPLRLVVDEMSLSVPVHKLPAGQDSMMRTCLQGRHYGLGVLGIAQRPATVSPDFRGQIERLWCFALPSDLDRRAVVGVIGSDHLDALRTLADHSYLEMASNGSVTRGRNLSPGQRASSTPLASRASSSKENRRP